MCSSPTKGRSGLDNEVDLLGTDDTTWSNLILVISLEVKAQILQILSDLILKAAGFSEVLSKF